MIFSRFSGGGVLLGIPGGGMPPGSPNPDPITDQKMSSRYSKIHTRLRIWPLGRIMSWLLISERKQKISSNAFRIRIFLFPSYSLEIETINTFIRSRSSVENHIRFHTPGKSLYPFLDPNGAKTLKEFPTPHPPFFLTCN